MDTKSGNITQYIRENMYFLIACLCAAIIFVSSTNLTYRINTLKYFVFAISVGILSLFFIIYILLNKKSEIRFHKALIIIYSLYFLFQLLPLLWADYTYDTPFYITIHLLTIIFLFIITNTVTSQKHILIIFIVFTISIGILSLLGILENYGFSIYRSSMAVQKNRVTISMGNPNYLGGLLVIIIPFSYGTTLYLLSKIFDSKKQKNLIIIGGILSTLCVIFGIIILALTTVRGAWAGSVIAFIIFSISTIYIFLKSSEKKSIYIKRVIIIILVITAIFIIIAFLLYFNVPYIKNRVDNTIEKIPNLEVFKSRIPAWEAGIKIWMSKTPLTTIFGNGLGSYYAKMFTNFRPDYRQWTATRSYKHVHNEYLELLVDGGIVTLLSWLLLLGLCFYYSLKVIRNQKAKMLNRIIAITIISGICGSLIHLIVSLALRTIAVHAIFYMLVGLSSVNYYLVKKDMKHENGQKSENKIVNILKPIFIKSIKLKFIILLVIIIFSVPSIYYAYRYFMSENSFIKSYTAKTIAGENGAIDWIDKSLQWNDRNIYTLYNSYRFFQNDPQTTLAICNRIESIIPNYRNVSLFKANAQARIPGTNPVDIIESFKNFVAAEAFQKEPYLRLITLLIMTKQQEDALKYIKDFFYWQNILYLESGKGRYNFMKTELSFIENSNQVKSQLDNERNILIAEIGVLYLKSLLNNLSNVQSDFETKYMHLILNIGIIYDNMFYSDYALDYYNIALQNKIIKENQDIFVSIMQRYMFYYSQVIDIRKKAVENNDKIMLLRANNWLKKYLESLIKIQPLDEYKTTLDAIKNEIKELMAK